MFNTVASSWAPNKIAKLEKLWREGLSASEIAAEIGGVSRSAVIGKVHRLGLAGRHVAERKKPSPARQNNAIAFRVRRRAQRKSVGLDGGIPEKIEAAFVPEPYGPWLHLTLLNNSTCRWPYGDPKKPDFGFCGAEVRNDGCPYCTYHAGFAYRAPPDRTAPKRPSLNFQFL